MDESLKILVGSVVIAGLITAFFKWLSDERSIEIKQVTEERTRWRAKIKELVVEIVAAYMKVKETGSGETADPKETESKESVETKIAKLRCQLQTNLNPFDDDDKKILSNFDTLFASRNDEEMRRFLQRITLLLKHDWERCKWESKSWWARMREQTNSLDEYVKNRKWKDDPNYRKLPGDESTN